jgi:outer membrane lipoprotein SlyB
LIAQVAVRIALGAALAIACNEQVLNAQFVPGAHVRVRHLDGCCEVTTTGALVSLDPASLSMRVADDSTTVTVPRTAIHSVEQAVRSESHVGTGMLVGAVVGGIAGSLIGQSRERCSGDGGPCLAPIAVGVDAIVAALAGLVVGAIVGSQIRSETWQQVELPARVSFRPKRGREGNTFGVVLSVSY